MKSAILNHYIELLEGTKIFFISNRLGYFMVELSKHGKWNSLVLPIAKNYLSEERSFLWHSVCPSKRYVYVVKNPHLEKQAKKQTI